MRAVTSQSRQPQVDKRRPAELPLVIDLDGGLLDSDFVQKTLIDRSIGTIGRLQYASNSLDVGFDYASLPYLDDVIEQARQARSEGKAVYLIAKASERVTLGIAAHLGLFKGVIASTIDRELTDQTKCDVLIREFGSKAFDYIGGSRCDQRILAAAAHSTLTSSRSGNEQPHSAPALGNNRLLIWSNALRIHQWTKNVLVFIPLLTSHQFSLANGLNATLAFFAFSLCASAAYLLNDMADLEADRAHPRKRLRAIASKQLSTRAAKIAVPFLLAVSILISIAISATFAGALLGYFALTVAYTLYLKRLVMVDIVVLAGLYTLRIVAGATAINVILSEWLLIFSIFIFTSLALIKRYAELAMRLDASLPDAANRDYGVSDMQIVGALAAASGLNAVTIISLYLSSPAVLALYSKPAFLWLLDPLLIYWIARALILSHRRQMNHDPVVFAVSDGPSQITALLMFIVVLAAI